MCGDLQCSHLSAEALDRLPHVAAVRLDGRMVGRWGRVNAYSLYPTKNLGAIGDGGIITTDELGRKMEDVCNRSS